MYDISVQFYGSPTAVQYRQGPKSICRIVCAGRIFILRGDVDEIACARVVTSNALESFARAYSHQQVACEGQLIRTAATHKGLPIPILSWRTNAREHHRWLSLPAIVAHVPVTYARCFLHSCNRYRTQYGRRI